MCYYHKDIFTCFAQHFSQEKSILKTLLGKICFLRQVTHLHNTAHTEWHFCHLRQYSMYPSATSQLTVTHSEGASYSCHSEKISNHWLPRIDLLIDLWHSVL